MLNIHAIRTCYPHWSQHSGFHQFVQYLDPQRYHIDLWAASDSDDDFPIQNRGIRALLRHQVQKRGMQWYKLSDLVAEIKAWKQCWTKRANIVHYFDGEHSAQYLPKLCKVIKTPTKIIATYHQPPNLIDELLDKTIIPHLDRVTVVSPSQVSYFSEFIEPHKIHLILHGIDTDYFQPGTLPKEAGTFRCITVGRYLRDFQALRQVAEALVNYDNIEFWVVSSNATEVENLPNMKVFQGIDDANLLRLYQTANALFLPLTDATANNALLEGIACGLPVISTLLPSVQAYLPNQEAILVKDNAPQRFVSAILELAHDPSRCIKMGERSRQRAEELDWRNIAYQYEQLYSEVVASG
jgi:glycosyltransferase involved in cell wall biosynthesis